MRGRRVRSIVLGASLWLVPHGAAPAASILAVPCVHRVCDFEIASITSQDQRWFRFTANIPGSDPEPWAQVLADRLGFNGFGFWPPLSPGSQAFIRTSSHSLNAFMPAANRDMPSYLYVYDPAQHAALEDALRDLTTADPSKIFWDGMPEFDQAGGDWTQGRPLPSGSLTPRQNYERFRDFYLVTLGIGAFITPTPEQRGYRFAAVSDYPWTAPWVLDWGADLVMGERIIDELSGMIPGMSFYRGTARQRGKPWGFDLSTWRYWTNSPTEYDGNDRLTGGWSSSWFKRHLYMGYMGGANVLEMEPAEYFNPAGPPNPLGRVVAEFAEFALERHRERPPEHVPFALIVDRYSAFDPKFGEYLQGNVVWHGRLPYSPGDYMLNNVLRMAYPDHWLHGTLVPGGPHSVAEYRARLAAGEDPRPWEPMGRSRWGDVFNVLDNATTVTGLSKHRVAMLTTHVPVDATLRGHFQQYAQAGGVLVLNAAQVSAADAALIGATLTGQTGQSTSSLWIADGSWFTEPIYTYAKVSLQGATVVARNAEGDPLITRFAVGTGEVYLTTPTLLQDNNRSQILNIGRKLFDVLADRYAPASVEGPSILYQLNADSRVTAVTLVNGGGTTWTGTVSFPVPASAFQAFEWTSDTPVATTTVGGRVVLSASVPPYDVRVYALELPDLIFENGFQ